jgi:cold shock CspA family protein
LHDGQSVQVTIAQGAKGPEVDSINLG